MTLAARNATVAALWLMCWAAYRMAIQHAHSKAAGIHFHERSECAVA